MTKVMCSRGNCNKNNEGVCMAETIEIYDDWEFECPYDNREYPIILSDGTRIEKPW